MRAIEMDLIMIVDVARMGGWTEDGK